MFEGTYTAIVTPFKNGEIDYPVFKKLIERQIEGGVEGIVPAGCTGEAATMSIPEQMELIKFSIDVVKGRIKIIAGTGSNNTKEAMKLTREASGLDIQGALIITPYYNKPTQTGIVSHYYALADASKVPLMVYNVPGRTGTKILPETVVELNKHPNIVAIKEACGSVDQVSEIISRCDIEVLSGDDPLTVPMISVGAIGVVSVTSNIEPSRISQLVRTALSGDFRAAAKEHLELLALHKSLFVESNPIPVKTILGEMGLLEKELRLPLEYGNTDTIELAREIISRFKLNA